MEQVRESLNIHIARIWFDFVENPRKKLKSFLKVKIDEGKRDYGSIVNKGKREYPPGAGFWLGLQKSFEASLCHLVTFLARAEKQACFWNSYELMNFQPCRRYIAS